MEKNYRKNEEMEPRQKQHPVVDVTGESNIEARFNAIKRNIVQEPGMLGP